MKFACFSLFLLISAAADLCTMPVSGVVTLPDGKPLAGGKVTNGRDVVKTGIGRSRVLLRGKS